MSRSKADKAAFWYGYFNNDLDVVLVDGLKGCNEVHYSYLVAILRHTQFPRLHNDDESKAHRSISESIFCLNLAYMFMSLQNSFARNERLPRLLFKLRPA